MKTPRRNCFEVIVQMLTKIPEGNDEFVKELQWNLEDSFYKPPEENIQWYATMNTLIKYIPRPEREWEFEVLSIFTTKSIEELKQDIDNE